MASPPRPTSPTPPGGPAPESSPANGAGNGWTMGLKGWLNQVSNLTAVALVCVMFFQSQQKLWDQVKEDRQQFMRLVEQGLKEQESVRRAQEQQRRILEDLARSTNELANEVRKLKEK
jgi:hypothetical protein